MLDIFDDSRDLSNNTLTSEKLSDNGERKTEHGSTSIEALRKKCETLRDSLVINLHNERRALGCSRGRDTALGKSGRSQRCRNSTGSERRCGDESGRVHDKFRKKEVRIRNC